MQRALQCRGIRRIDLCETSLWYHVCCSVLQCDAMCWLQCVAVCCSVLQCVAVCCSVLQRVWQCELIHVTRLLGFTWLVHMCQLTRSYLLHHSYTCDTWLTRLDSFICVPWLIYIWLMTDMTPSDVCPDSFLCRTSVSCMNESSRLVLMSCITHSYMTHDSHDSHDSFIHVTGLVHMCAMTPSRVCHDSFMRLPWLER